MKLFRESTEDFPKARIELIPMIDIMFFLLVVFIFLSISLIKLNGVTVALPKASDHPLKKPPKVINLSIDQSGRLFFGKEGPMTLQILKKRLLALSANKSKTYEMIVSGDKNARLQRLVDVMDLANTLGFSDISIRTEESP